MTLRVASAVDLVYSVVEIIRSDVLVIDSVEIAVVLDALGVALVKFGDKVVDSVGSNEAFEFVVVSVESMIVVLGFEVIIFGSMVVSVDPVGVLLRSTVAIADSSVEAVDSGGIAVEL